jgi:uncharacterized protein YyaL (SSP411 family)
LFGDFDKAVDTAHLNSRCRPTGNIYYNHHHLTDNKALKAVTTTLDNMAFGGIYDQLGGGFHSTDEDWLVPHFEKCFMTMPN